MISNSNKQPWFGDYTGEDEDEDVKHYLELNPNTIISNVLSFIAEHPGHFSAFKDPIEDEIQVKALNYDNVRFSVYNKPNMGCFIFMDFEICIGGEKLKLPREQFLNTKDDVMILFYNTFQNLICWQFKNETIQENIERFKLI